MKKILKRMAVKQTDPAIKLALGAIYGNLELYGYFGFTWLTIAVILKGVKKQWQNRKKTREQKSVTLAMQR
jgi:hypothetical protein